MMKQDFYGKSIFEEKTIIDRLKYKGHGRPKKTDYINLIEAQRQINKIHSKFLSELASPIKGD